MPTDFRAERERAMWTAERLLEKIRLGEDSLLELKEFRFSGGRVTAPGRNGLADEIAAFANGNGGVCVLGVKDHPREIAGIPAEAMDLAEKLVVEACTDCVVPMITPVIQRLGLPSEPWGENALLVVEVERSPFVHQSPGGYLRRVGSSKKRLTPDLLARLLQERALARTLPFDEMAVSGAALADLDERLCKAFRTEASDDALEVFLRKLGMAVPDSGGLLRPSVAGVLMGSADPCRWLPNAFVQAVAYRGTTTVPESPSSFYQLDAKDISGPLPEQILETCRFVHRNMKVAAVKDMGRIDFPQYDMTSIFEAVVNAVAHRDYSLRGSKIRLRMFSDRVELYVPGGLINGIDLEALPHRQAVRNAVLTSLLARSPVPVFDWLQTSRKTMMDRRGEGVPLIVRSSEALSGRRPEYRLLGDSELMLTIWAANTALVE